MNDRYNYIIFCLPFPSIYFSTAYLSQTQKWSYLDSDQRFKAKTKISIIRLTIESMAKSLSWDPVIGDPWLRLNRLQWKTSHSHCWVSVPAKRRNGVCIMTDHFTQDQSFVESGVLVCTLWTWSQWRKSWGQSFDWWWTAGLTASPKFKLRRNFFCFMRYRRE